MARVSQYLPGYNLPSYNNNNRIDYDTLKQLSKVYDVLRKAIEVRKAEIITLPWDITVKNANRPGSHKTLESSQARIDKVKARFAKPDMKRTYGSWLSKGIEDLLVGDYMSLSTVRSLGGDVLGWRWIDGATIKVRIDVLGEIPFRPEVAYQQILYGMPRFDFFEASDPMPYRQALDLWRKGDFRNKEAFAEPGELRYRVRCLRNESNYGISPVEQFIVLINNALRHQLWEAAFWTDGNVPSALIAAPPTWTADQLEEYQLLWDSMMAGDPAHQRQVRWIPGGSQVQNIESALAHSAEFAEYLIDMTCFCMDTSREELSLPGKNVSGSAGDSAGKTDRHRERVSLRPTAMWLKSEILDPLIQEDMGEADLEWVWTSLTEENERDRAEVNQILINSGQKSIDEVVAENGGTPPGIGRMLVTGAQVFFEQDLVRGTKEGVGALVPATESYRATQPRQPIQPGEHAGSSEQPDNSAPAGGVQHGGKAAQLAELKQYRRKVDKAVKAGLRAAEVPFSPEHLTARQVGDIRIFLDVADPAAVFEAARASIEAGE